MRAFSRPSPTPTPARAPRPSQPSTRSPRTGPPGYATLARLRGAEEVAKTDKAKAIERLDALSEDKKVDSLTREVADLRSAIYTMELGDRDKIMMKLGPLMTENGVFRFSAQEWTGLDALEDKDFDEAERVFNILLRDTSAPAGLRQRAQAYQGLLHAARGVKGKPGAITSITPVVEFGRRPEPGRRRRDGRDEASREEIGGVLGTPPPNPPPLPREREQTWGSFIPRNRAR